MWQLIGVIFIIFLLLAGLVFYFLKNKTKPVDATESLWSFNLSSKSCEADDFHIPTVIWSYWHSVDRPLAVQACINNWEKMNPGYEIHVLSENDLGLFLSDVPAQIYAVDLTKRADWIRLALLAKYGGIWLDASVILTQSLDWVNDPLTKKNADFVGYYLDGYSTQDQCPVVENWFMAATKNSQFIQDWFAVFHQQVILESTDVYLGKLRESGLYGQLVQKIGSASYHTMHVACQQLLQVGLDLSESKPKAYPLSLTCAEKSAYAYHVQSHWKRRPLFIRLLWNRQEKDVPALIKLRGGERRKIEFYLKYRIFRKRSVVGLNLL